MAQSRQSRSAEAEEIEDVSRQMLEPYALLGAYLKVLPESGTLLVYFTPLGR